MKYFVLAAVVAIMAPFSFAATVVSCTVTSGTVLTAAGGGLTYSIANGTGTSSGGATGVITCPGVSTGVGTIVNYQVLAQADYQGGPFGTTSGTSVTQVLTLVGGSLNGASATQIISGGAGSNSYSLGTPFQIGSTLSGATSYAGFTVNVGSSVTLGGPVAGSSGQIVISYDVATVPEPATLGMVGFGLLGLGFFGRRRK